MSLWLISEHVDVVIGMCWTLESGLLLPVDLADEKFLMRVFKVPRENEAIDHLKKWVDCLHEDLPEEVRSL